MPAATAAGEQTKLAATLGAVLRGPFGDTIAITDLRRLSGGASHETWAFAVARNDSVTRLVLRRDFPQPLMPGDLEAEYGLLSALHAAGFPVAKPIWFGNAENALGVPAMIVEQVDGTDLRKTLAAANPATDRTRLADKVVALQAAIHALDWQDIPGLEPISAAEQLATWSEIIRTESKPRPLLAAAIMWLQANLPSTSAPVLVHGDFKTNNLLKGAAGELFVIDWEMAHVGDAFEDLAWTLLWTTPYDLVGGLISRKAYLAEYNKLTGIVIDPPRLLFWEIFALFKLAGIFVSGARGGKTPRPVCLQLMRAIPWLEAKIAEHMRCPDRVNRGPEPV